MRVLWTELLCTTVGMIILLRGSRSALRNNNNNYPSNLSHNRVHMGTGIKSLQSPAAPHFISKIKPQKSLLHIRHIFSLGLPQLCCNRQIRSLRINSPAPTPTATNSLSLPLLSLLATMEKMAKISEPQISYFELKIPLFFSD